MRLSRTQGVALGGLAVAAALVVLVALRNPQPPLLPADEAHAVANEACLTCHDDDGPAPRPADHPFGQDCRRCHGSR